MAPWKEKEPVYATEFLERRRLSENTFEFIFTRPADVDFTPGQHLRFIYQNMEREYSLVSLPSDETMTLCVRNTRTGNFSSILASAMPGDKFYVTGPHGHFVFRPSVRIPIFAATGTGIAPFVSMVRSGVNGFIMMHGVQTPQELYYEHLFRDAACLYVPCLSASRGSAPDDAFHGRVTTYIQDVLTNASYDFYLCGRADMIRDVMFLVDERFPNSRIYSERFY
jgi:NAD(P)H-flavin reductase